MNELAGLRGDSCNPVFSCRDSGTGLHVIDGLPVPAAVSEVLSLLKLRLHQGTADTGVADVRALQSIAIAVRHAKSFAAMQDEIA